MKTRTKLIINFTLLIINFLFTSCYTWWENHKELDTSTGHISLGDFLYEEEEITSLTAPSQVIASQGLYSSTIKLRWTDVENAASYRIERAVVKPDSSGSCALPEDNDFEVLEKYVYSTSYSDVILTNPSSSNSEYSYKYYYRISAENLGKGYESSEFTSIENDETAAEGWLLPAPQNLDAWKGKSIDSIQLNWQAVTGASSYEIYRTEKSNGLGMEKIATVRGSSNTYTDSIIESEQGKEFYYKVCAVLSGGSTSAWSIIAMGYSLMEGTPSAPENLQVINGYGTDKTTLNLQWDYVSSASTQTITYSVYRTSETDSSFVLIKNNISQDTTNLSDSDGLKAGIKYYYYIQSVSKDSDGSTKKSPYSETGPDSSSPAMGFLLAPPANIEITDGSDSNHEKIRFTPAAGSELQTEAYSYKIYYDSQYYGSYSSLLMENITGLETDEDGYCSVEVEKHPFFKMTTVNSSGLESDYSTAAAPFPAAPQNVTASKTKGGTLVTDYSPNTNGIYPVLITWTKPSEDTPYAYNVYRSTRKDSSFRKLNDSAILAGDASTFSYVDENSTAQAATFYYYKVVSLNILEAGKNSNNPETDTANNCRGYGAISRDDWFRQYNKTVMNSQSKLTLMHKSNDMDKLGSETVYGTISGSLTYTAAVAGLGAKITMPYTNYADFYINDDPSEGVYFLINGNTDTTSDMSGNGNMSGTVTCSGMYPGIAGYDTLEIKNKGAGGGYYLVQTLDLDGNEILSSDQVNWKVGEEGR